MNSIEVFFLLAMLMMASALTLSATLEELTFFNQDNNDQNHGKTSLRGTSSVFLASQGASNGASGSNGASHGGSNGASHGGVAAKTCDKSPMVCSLPAAAGPACCNKKCVDLKKDKLNCGKCGGKCKQTEKCCNGHIVNPMSDKNHCGRCNHACKKGNSCAFGMCSYA